MSQSDINTSPFRFFDNREKYLLFVNTCNEKQVIAERISMDVKYLRPSSLGLRVFDAGMGDGRVAMGFSHLAPTHQVLGIEYDPILFNQAVSALDRLCKKKVVDPSRLHLVQGNYLDFSDYQPLQEHLRGPCLVMNYPETRLGNHERLAEFLENNLSHEVRLCLLSHNKLFKAGQFEQDSCHEIQATDGSVWWASLLKLREVQ